MILDANILLYSVDRNSSHHRRSADWLSEAFSGSRRIGLPWQSLGAFLRIATHPRIFAAPLTASQAWSAVENWLSAPVTWLPTTSRRTGVVLGRLVKDLDVRGNLVTDAQLAALALEHGVAVVSTDSDFARFPGLEWINPLSV